jgi:hypothetical protein
LSEEPYYEGGFENAGNTSCARITTALPADTVGQATEEGSDPSITIGDVVSRQGNAPQRNICGNDGFTSLSS